MRVLSAESWICPPPLHLTTAVLYLGVAMLASCGQAEKTPPAAPETPAAPTTPGPDLTALRDSNAAALLLPYLKQYPAEEVIVRTRLGNMRVRLYDDTPVHKANFLLLARRGVFDETVFNRVVKDFAIQGGRSENRTIRIARYRLPAEFRAEHIHKHGALAMARYDDKINPDRRSSAIDFYFVQGEKLTPDQTRQVAGRPLTPEQVRTYATLGGVPALDGKYTVFGEVVDGLEVIDKIAAEPVDPYKWPLTDVGIKVEVVE